MKNEITNLMEKYRESSRNTWNTYFKDIQDGDHEFINVNSALFQGLVLTSINDLFDHNKIYESICVVPTIPSLGVLEIMFLPNGATSGKWEMSRITDTNGTYHFIEFFDWRDPEGVMDNNFVLALAYDIRCNQEISGNRVLLPYGDVKFYDANAS